MKKINAVLIDIIAVNYLLFIFTRVFASGNGGWAGILLYLAGSVCGVLWSISGFSPGCLALGLTIEKESGIWSGLRSVFIWIICAGTLLTGMIIIKFSPAVLFDIEGLRGAGRIFSAMLHPDFMISGMALSAIIETVYTALTATVAAVPFAFILSFAGAKNLMSKNKKSRFLYAIVRALLNFFRSVEPLIWAIIFSVWVGIGPFAGMLALTVNSIAGLIKLFSEQIENIDEGLVNAIAATGASPVYVIWYAIVPQIMVPFVAYTVYRWDVNVRMATVIGIAGGGGIGTLLMQYQGLAKWNEVGLIIIMISVAVWIIDFTSAKIRESIL